MKPKISSYKELLEHQGQLKALLEVKKDLMRSDVELLKIETKPVSDLFGGLSDSERKRRLLAIGVAFAAKTVLQKIILRKAGWVVKLIAPYFAENSRFDLQAVMSKFKKRISSILKKNPMESDDGEEDMASRAIILCNLQYR
jgi:hypothetical protein